MMPLCCGHLAAVLVLVNICLVSFSVCQFRPAGEMVEIMDFDLQLGEKLNAEYWQRQSLDALKRKFAQLGKAGFPPVNKMRRAKNVILFMGDGLGVSGITATRKFKETYSGDPFYKNQLVWDSFPFAGLAKTYELDNVVADSAGSATAYLAGIKTRMGFIGLDGSGDLTCNTTKGQLESFALWATRAGKSAGVVTTTTITHASPSPLYAHLPAPLRPYEYSADKFKFPRTHPNCEDIAKQFVKKGQHLKVTLGGGRAHFTPNTDIPIGEISKHGLRNDGRNLIDEWKTDRSKVSTKKPTYVTSREELLNLDPKSTDYLLGLFHYDHMTFVDDGPPPSEPSLAEMTTAAIRVLGENKDGFFLFVEGGRIDHGHHNGMARYALVEGIEFDKAIKAALDMTDPNETLIIVTADHSHTLSLGGYLSHNSSILGLSVNLGYDKKTFTSLMYANGPGANLTGPEGPYTGTRRNDSVEIAAARGYRQQAVVPLRMEGHGGEDVPVYATGVYSELFTGVFEQNLITWAMACASGVHFGPSGKIVAELEEMCPRPFRSGALSDNSNGASLQAHFVKLSTTFAIFVTVAINFARR